MRVLGGRAPPRSRVIAVVRWYDGRMIPCPTCDRFVRTDSNHCPFCDATLRDGSMLGSVVVGALLGLGTVGCGEPGDGGTESEAMGSYESEVAAYAGPAWDLPPEPADESGTTSTESVGTTNATDTGTSTMTATETGSDTATESGSGSGSGSESGSGSGSGSGTTSGG